MGHEDVTSGRIKQIKGKANEIAGAVTGNTGRQIKGKLQHAVGTAQVAIGKATTNKRSLRTPLHARFSLRANFAFLARRRFLCAIS
jgi:uncharacterized protein YjbJ (UPF0337 family)